MIPKIDPIKLFNKFQFAELDIKLTMWSFESGNISLYELFIISILSQRSKFSILELGTFNGRTANNLALNSGKSVITIDLPPNVNSALPMADQPGADERGYIGKYKLFKANLPIKQIWCDTAKLKEEYPFDHEIDFIFIDASHSYEYVKHDSEYALSILHDGGIIVWHDYDGWPGVTKGLNELYESDPNNVNSFRHIDCTSFVIYCKDLFLNNYFHNLRSF
jgi:predicted O-methyltransferase YrrM